MNEDAPVAPQPQPGSVLAELNAAIERLSKVASVDARDELLGTTYPLINMIAVHLGAAMTQLDERLVELDGQMQDAQVSIAALATSGESMILMDLAGQIDDVLGLGLQLATVADRGGDQDRAIAARYRNAVEALREELDRVTVEDDELDDADDDSDDNDNDDDDDSELADELDDHEDTKP